jgi:head-tail adaptor
MSGRRMNRALVLERQDRVSDGAGGLSPTWIALGTLWAEVRGTAGGMQGMQGVETSKVQLKIVVRSAPVGNTMRPEPDQRFREGTRLYRINAVVEDDPSGRFVTCFASEEVAV